VFINRQVRPFLFQCADAPETSYYGMVSISKFDLAAPVKGVYSADVTFQVTGEPTLV
jgi:hypothetical protein